MSSRIRLPLLASAAAAVLLTAAPAGADPGDPSPAWVPDGRVNAVAVDGSTAYIGGAFSRIAPYTGGAVSLDPVSGERQAPWPDVAGDVWAAARDDAGGWYLGGHFGAVGGVARQNVAHVLADGSVDPAFTPTTDGAVFALVVRGKTVYAGGSFKTAGGVEHRGLAALDAETGAALDFDVSVSGTVRTLAVAGSVFQP